MPRPPRLWFPEALYHLIVRGNNREPVFFAERDYHTYLRILKDAKRECRYLVYAYALMTNHVHLMVQTDATHPLSKFMQTLSGAYAMYLNRRYRRVGHVFQGRYRSILVERDAYALELVRYIHLNPVRGGIVKHPDQYRWSSFHAYVGSDEYRLVDSDLILTMLTPVRADQRETFQQFMLTSSRFPTMGSPDESLTTGHILGSPAWIAGLRQKQLANSGVRPQSGTFPIGV